PREMEVVDREMVAVEAEPATDRIELGRLHRLAELGRALDMAVDRAERRIEETRAGIGDSGEDRRAAVIGLAEMHDEGAVRRIVEIRGPEGRILNADRGIAHAG